MAFERPKIVVVVRDDLLAWQELNVTAFLVSGLTAAAPDLVGEPYVDADGQSYLPMLGHPVSVLSGDAATLTAARARAAGRGMAVSIYTAQLFATGNDADNRAEVAAVGSDDLDLVGVGVVGERNAVDRVVKGARLHG
ncbi:DUF2000 domain-containing protein [Desertihabitans brevis]|uniref:DUF2000 domain-containing protein n=1 Tax=Desertihabitans brevis TaxID=2268447 RepID=A0A367YWS5_9ACTN|nr:DUF2000 domain-containing protein [Desertihabitans brevis]RCK70324.1 DUF2000 domain-containing protein [Desertihabitans brevis]